MPHTEGIRFARTWDSCCSEKCLGSTLSFGVVCSYQSENLMGEVNFSSWGLGLPVFLSPVVGILHWLVGLGIILIFLGRVVI